MNTIWRFELGKASIGETVRQVNKPRFTFAFLRDMLLPEALSAVGLRN